MPVAVFEFDITITGMASINPDCIALISFTMLEPLPEMKIATRLGIKVSQCIEHLNLQ